MRPATSFACCLLCGSLVAPWARAQDDAAPVRKPYGIEKRVLWTTSHVVGTPDPPAPYRVEAALPHLKFAEPLALVGMPRAPRMFVVERAGKIYSFRTDDNKPAKLLLDVGKMTYGFALHPRFPQAPYVYVTYILDPETPQDEGTHLSRFTVTAEDSLRADPDSEQILLKWPSGGHNGGCLRFGPDGYLYVAVGDGSGIADERVTGQDVSDLLASLLRIDVDHPSDGRPYGIPKDNPFVGRDGARPEVFAYGLRQAWKFSFDRSGGDLWAGEVGQDLWEMIYRIQPGGNYGWSVREGLHPFRPQRPKGPTPILDPVVEHPHSDFRSITGGYVYHGTRLKELTGAYIYGDYDTGRVWALRYDAKQPAGKRVTWQKELADTPLRIVAFGEGHDGEIYLLDFVGGGLHRLVAAPQVAANTDFPRKLSETGLFASVKDHVPAPGLIPYSVNSPLWSDGAIKERFLALPGDSQIEFETVTYPQPAPGSTPGWRFPNGTVVVKTFSLETPQGTRRIETRLLHYEQLAGNEEVGDQYWRGYTYVWNDEQTDAVLVETKGLDRTYTVKDARAAGGTRQLKWRFPSRAECTLCHTMSAKYVLGLNTRQMNKDHDYVGVVANQLATLDHLGVFTEPLPEKPEKMRRIYDHRDPRVPLERRARSYLDSNCSHCHRKWGGGNAQFQLLSTLPLAETGTLNVRPGHGDFQVAGGKLLVPGDPDRSLILVRMKLLGLGRMPHVASNVVDEEAVRVIREWIAGMPAEAAGK